MKLPCSVTRDLLPLYAENMVEPETKDLIEQHLSECASCQNRLSEMNAPTEPSAETIQPLQTLKKEIRNRRLQTALITALCVFIGFYIYFFRVTSMKYVPWQDGLIEVARVENISPEEFGIDDGPAPGNDGTVPVPTVAPGSDENSMDALILNVSSFINGFEEHVVIEDDGTTTVVIQAVSVNQGLDSKVPLYTEYTYYPVPDRLIYGFEQPQKLLWGTPLNKEVEVLPRLALATYLQIAASLAGLSGLLWLVFRRWLRSWILRQLFFAPISYILSHLFLKGIKSTSFFMEHDLLGILLVAIAVYALLSITWQVFRNRRKEA